jgi:hypothetical protein
MRWIGYRAVKYASVVMDVADVRKRSKAAHVAELAQNIRDTGDEPINAPIVRTPGARLLCGRDRMAALMILKAKKVWVRFVECTDIEAADLEAWENVFRRNDNRAEVLAAAVRAKEALIRAREQGTVSPAPQRSVKAQARKEVARAAGISPASVKKAEQRAAKASAEGSAGPPPNAQSAEPSALFVPCIDLLGLPIDGKTQTANDWSADVQAALDEADKHLRLAQAALKRLEVCTFPATIGQQLRAEVHRIADRVRSERPASICPWCKHVPEVTATCNPCKTLGYVSADVMSRAPRECIQSSGAIATGRGALSTPPIVMWNGQAVPYVDAVAGRWPKNGRAAAPAKKANGISVVLPDGSEADLSAEFDEDRA